MKRSTGTPDAAMPNWHGRRYIIIGTLMIVTLFGGGGWWSMNTEISGAVVASAELRVETKQKPVQHPEGGVVGAIFVKEGQQVKAGDPLIRLDQTTQSATYEIVDTQFNDLRARQARLLAERDGKREVAFSQDVLALAVVDVKVAKVVSDQRQLFAVRLNGGRQQVAQFRERIAQLENEIRGGSARRTSFISQLGSVNEELGVQETLLARGLTTRTRLQEFRREKARIEGELGALDADGARLMRQIQETRIEISRLIEARRETAITELRDVEVRIAELEQRRVVAQDALQKIELRAPQDGVVQDLTVFAPGAVVAPGAAMMVIVPVADKLVLEARIDANKRDQIELGRAARVRFTSFNQRTTPELDGELIKISADRKEDERTGVRYYSVEVQLSEAQRARIGSENRLVPGLPAEIYIQTDERTPLSYLLKPLTDNFSRALLEG